MEDLIKALQIFLKYGNPRNPTYCFHNELRIMDIEPNKVSAKDVKTLERLGFFVDECENCFYSLRYGDG